MEATLPASPNIVPSYLRYLLAETHHERLCGSSENLNVCLARLLRGGS